MMFDTPSLSENFHEELQRGIAKALVETGGRVGMKNADDLVVEIENCSLIWESYMGIRSRAHVCIVATKGHGPSKRFARVEGVADEGSAMVRMASTAEPQLTRAIDKCIAELVRSTPLQDSRNESPTPGVTTGTCFAVASDGWLVTAEHVIKDKVSLEVQIGSAAVAATVVARDHEGDLALLRVGVPTPDFLVIDPIWKTEIGKEVYSLGFPAVGFLSQDIRYNNGTVSAERALEGNLHLFQISVPAQPGNSGGPLLSKTSGGLVGVIVSKASVKAFLSAMGTLPEGITFAVQAQRVQSLLAAAQIRPGLATETDVDHARKATFLIICK
jgi:S1-C subfamily serine protease